MILPPLVFNRSNNNNFPNVSLVGPKSVVVELAGHFPKG